MSSLFTADDLIHAYTRREALQDGMLRSIADLVPDEPNLAVQFGWRHELHVALTAAVAALVEPTEREQHRRGQDLKGRLCDVLYMARLAAGRSQGESTILFQVIFEVSGRQDFTDTRGRMMTGKRYVTLKAVIHGGDEGEPVLTIMLAHES